MTINDFISQVVLRITPDSDLTTVNRELTFAEGDSFRIAVKDFLKDLVSGAGLNPYNAGTTYTGTYYVSYNGNMYMHVSASPSTGVTPGTNAAVWQLVSIGALAHPQNSDLYLNFGGATQVSAADLYELLSNQTISITSAAFEVLRAAGTLKKNRYYQITDVGYVSSLLVHTSGISTFHRNGLALLQLPITTGQEPWISGGTYGVNDYATYQNLVYKNTTGVNTASPPPSDGVNWLSQSPNGARYQTVFMPCKFNYDAGVFSIVEVYDADLDNNWYSGTMMASSYPPRISGSTGNYNDNSSTIDASEFRGVIVNNRLIKSNVVIPGGDGNVQGLSGNLIICGGVSMSDDMDGEVENNNLSGATLSFPVGQTASGDINGNTVVLPLNSTLNVRASAALSGKLISPNGSNAQDTIVMTGLTVVPLDTNGYPDIYGEFIMSSTNASETVTRFTNRAHALFPIKIYPESGLTLTVTTTAYASVASAGQVVGGAASYVLNGSKGDYLEIEPVTIGGFAVWRVKTTSIVL